MLSRRQFGLLLSSALVSAPKLSLAHLIAPDEPIAPLLPVHPFLSVQYAADGLARVLTVKHEIYHPETFPTLYARRLRIHCIQSNPVLRVPSIQDAEDEVIARILREAEAVTFVQGPMVRWTNGMYAPSPNLMNRVIQQANLIGQMTRRGAGNIVLAHPASIGLFNQPIGAMTQEFSLPTFGNDWFGAGVSGTMRFLTSHRMRQDKIIVLYNDSRNKFLCDGPAFVTLADDGVMRLGYNEANQALATSMDYCRVITL